MDWVKLGVRYYADAKIAGFPDDIADAAEVMFTRGMARAGEERAKGFIPGSAIPELTRRRRYDAVVDALVAAGLWSRVPGGYQIVRWADWQDALDALTQRRDSDRERKRRSRAAAAGGPAGPQEPPKVSRDTALSRDKPQMSRDQHQLSRDMSRDVTPPDKEKERDLGGSSNSKAHYTRDPGPQPPPRCPKHLENRTDDPCRACGNAREAREAWDIAQARAAALERSTAAQERAQTERAAIDTCRWCDTHGKRLDAPAYACSHTAAVPARKRISPTAALERERAPAAAARQRGSALDELDAALAEQEQP